RGCRDVRSAPASRRGSRAGRILRGLPWTRARNRAATGAKRDPLQHGFRRRDRLFARGGNRDRHRSPMAMGAGRAPRCGRSGRGGRGLLHVEGIRVKSTATPRTAVLTIVALAIPLCPVPAEAHLNSTGMGPIYDGLVHFLTSLEDLVPVLALSMLAGLRGAR